MADDIVTRLRSLNFVYKDILEAADEIERLRAVIKWFEHTQTCPNYGKKQCWECVTPANQRTIMKEMFE